MKAIFVQQILNESNNVYIRIILDTVDKKILHNIIETVKSFDYDFVKERMHEGFYELYFYNQYPDIEYISDELFNYIQMGDIYSIDIVNKIN